MNKLIINKEFGLLENGKEVFCNSRMVSELFDKEHKNVIRDIEEIIESLNKKDDSSNLSLPNFDIYENFANENFIKSYYKTKQNKNAPEYLLTKKGFSL